MSTIREEIKRIENIKELLNVPDFWLSKPWQSWSLTLFDLMACQKIWGVTKNQSHCYLKDDAKEILNVLPHCNQKIIPRIRQLLLEMENRSENKVNLYFWKEIAFQTSAAALRLEIAEFAFSSTRIELATNVLDKRNYKRKVNEMTEYAEYIGDDGSNSDVHRSDNSSNSSVF